MISDLSEFRFTYAPQDPSIVTAEFGCRGAGPPEPQCEASVSLTGLKSGETTLRVTVRRASDDTVVATGTMNITVML